MNQAERRRWLIEALLAERGEKVSTGAAVVPAAAEDQRQLLRALMNVRPPLPASEEFLAVQDAYLQERRAERGVTLAEGLFAPDERIAVWQGDITTLCADAIVNAANDQMLGCFVPGHSCIDNAIHTFAGVELRLACAELMDAQGHAEATGGVKATGGFNLPAAHVFHTVGPIVGGGRPGPRQRLLLRSCYESCLAEATRRGLKTLAFCCISTGVFGYPNREAAEVAIDAVRTHLSANDSQLKVVFNVFLAKDRDLYEELLARD